MYVLYFKSIRPLLHGIFLIEFMIYVSEDKKHQIENNKCGFRKREIDQLLRWQLNIWFDCVYVTICIANEFLFILKHD